MYTKSLLSTNKKNKKTKFVTKDIEVEIENQKNDSVSFSGYQNEDNYSNVESGGKGSILIGDSFFVKNLM